MSAPSDLQRRIDELAYPPTHEYDLETLTPRGVLAQRMAIIDRIAPDFLRTPGVLLDVGANKGFMSLLARRQGFTVDAIEPDARYAALLRDLGLCVSDRTFRDFVPPLYRYDRAFVGNVGHYCYRESGFAWIWKLAAMMKPGGLVLLEGPVDRRCADLRACMSEARWMAYTEDALRRAIELDFTLVTTAPAVAYTPDREVWLLRRRRTGLDLPPVPGVPGATVPVTTIFTNRLRGSRVIRQGDTVWKDHGSLLTGSMLRSVRFAALSPFATDITGPIEAPDGIRGWTEEWIEGLEAAGRDEGAARRKDPAALAGEEPRIRRWFEHNAALARLGMFDEDPGYANWGPREGSHSPPFQASLCTGDKNAVTPIAELTEESIRPWGSLWRTWGWSYRNETCPDEWRHALAAALATRDSFIIERFCMMAADSDWSKPPGDVSSEPRTLDPY